MRAWIACAMLAACSPGETCVMERISYEGGATGAVFVNEQYTDADGGFAGSAIGERYPSVALATARPPPSVIVGGGSCWGSSLERHESIDATAWIDVGAHYADGGCSESDCRPQPGDPVGHRVMAIRGFEQNWLDITILDP